LLGILFLGEGSGFLASVGNPAPDIFWKSTFCAMLVLLCGSDSADLSTACKQLNSRGISGKKGRRVSTVSSGWSPDQPHLTSCFRALLLCSERELESGGRVEEAERGSLQRRDCGGAGSASERGGCQQRGAHCRRAWHRLAHSLSAKQLGMTFLPVLSRSKALLGPPVRCA
jgi:hypothetical protein